VAEQAEWQLHQQRVNSMFKVGAVHY
jgi:hypothetical protein